MPARLLSMVQQCSMVLLLACGAPAASAEAQASACYCCCRPFPFTWNRLPIAPTHRLLHLYVTSVCRSTTRGGHGFRGLGRHHARLPEAQPPCDHYSHKHGQAGQATGTDDISSKHVQAEAIIVITGSSNIAVSSAFPDG